MGIMRKLRYSESFYCKIYILLNRSNHFKFSYFYILALSRTQFGFTKNFVFEITKGKWIVFLYNIFV